MDDQSNRVAAARDQIIFLSASLNRKIWRNLTGAMAFHIRRVARIWRRPMLLAQEFHNNAELCSQMANSASDENRLAEIS